MKKSLFVLSLFISYSYASPANYWDSGFGQGWNIYLIKSTNKTVVRISCNTGAGSQYGDHSVEITRNDKEIKGDITFIINEQLYHVPTLDTSTRGGGAEWDKTMTALAKATKFDLYINDEFVAKYTPSKVNIKSVLGNEKTFCESQLAHPFEF